MAFITTERVEWKGNKIDSHIINFGLPTLLSTGAQKIVPCLHGKYKKV